MSTPPIRQAQGVPRQRRVVVLGSTGSIGESALKVARDIPERMKIVGLAANRNAARFAEQVREVRPVAAALSDPTAAEEARGLLQGESLPAIAAGAEALCELAVLPEADLVLIAIVGTAGLRPALAAIEAGKDIAVASKEILVMAGEAVMEAARRKGVRVLPVDSEHNAIFQCLEGHRPDEVKRLILTASGGPFRTLPAAELANVTLERALKHPTWTMGAKITIDSATLFNKGLEMIEARWLFDVEMARVDVIVHPQSIVHSMVEFIDGSVLAQLSVTDMCFPIQYAVTWPERVPNTLPPIDFATLSRLDFEAPRRADFPALDLARQAGETGGTLPAVLNAANEVAVEAFLNRRCGFAEIWQTVGRVMHEHPPVAHPTLDVILEADEWARRRAHELLSNQ
ncbi:MAG TPA: 1-deoxy-D-xylulose-5-phosphate reductoisomerase [Chthoniobacteraceae bacterium]|jgi:1-deoxy-D-xylulose-5-phosphate reductoisomerase|nr:1-deoxy-D-xylulose-5-phosphate reductoisomerase [Chthoniobacteraceae bacterium]